MKKNKWYNFFCPNKDCKTYGKKGLGNIISNGHDRNGARKLKCNTCNKSFNETKGTPFFGKHLSKREIIKISKQFVEKTSIRGVARATGHHLDTIRALAGDVAEHCYEVTGFLIKDVKLGTHEIDEFWSFVKKNKRKLSKKDLETMNKVTHTPISILKEKLASL
jgi:transposase-like protein